MNFIAFLQDPFLQMALWASLLSSIASGMIGSFVIIKRISFIAGGIAHSLLGGMGACLWLQRTYGIAWLDPLIGAFLGAIISGLVLGWIHLHYRQREDAVISAIWSTGMALGVIFLSITPGTNVDLMNYLFGNILWINHNDLLLLGLLDIVILLVICFYYRRFVALCFDEEQALLRGIPVQRLYMLLLALVAITIVLLIQVIGTILVIALLTIPATLASLCSKKLPWLMFLSVLFAAFFGFSGLSASYLLNWPPGSTIALTASIIYFFSLLIKKQRWIRRFLSLKLRPSRIESPLPTKEF